MVEMDKEQGDLVLRLLAREHLCLHAEGGDRQEIMRIKDLMRAIAKGVFGADCGPGAGSGGIVIPAASPKNRRA